MNNAKKISQIVSAWVTVQKNLAEKLSITPASLSAMLSGKVNLPLERFLQIVHILRPPQEKVNKVWKLYLADLNIPQDILDLTMRNYNAAPIQDDVRSRIHKLVDSLDEQQLIVVEPILLIMKRQKNK